MIEQEFIETRDKILDSYSEGLVQFGNETKEDALEQYATLLPDGFHTPGTAFYVALNPENEEIGVVFLIDRQPGIALLMWIELNLATTEVAGFLVRRAAASCTEVLHALPKREFGPSLPYPFRCLYVQQP